MLRLLTIGALVATLIAWNDPAHARAPVRSVGTIAWAIGVDHGHLPLATRRTYASVIRDVAKRYDFDGFTAVALIRNESRFRAGAIGDDGAAIGLAQIHYQYLCSGAEACAQKRAALLDPAVNIATMGRLIDQKRAWCRQQTGKPALFARWLHAYGFNQTRNVKCNMRRTKKGWVDLPVPTELRTIIHYRKRLIRLLARKRRR